MIGRFSGRLAVSILLLAAYTVSLSAQRQPPFLVGPRDSLPVAQRTYPPTYWMEGAVIGAAVAGTTLGWIFYEVCGYDEAGSGCDAGNLLLGVGVGAVFGGVVGGLIGGAFTAPHAHPLRGHPVKAAGMGAAAAALWSFGVFSQFCTNGCSAPEVRFGLTTVAIGAMAGWLVGH
jgi:hypothetical protein